MNSMLALLFLAVLPCTLAVIDLDISYYDIMAVYNQFYAECGNATNPSLSLIWGGEAASVYAKEDPIGCSAEEIAPAVFYLADANATGCPVQTSLQPHISTLEMVVQKGLVRKYTDPTYIINCNYELGGQQATVTGQETFEGFGGVTNSSDDAGRARSSFVNITWPDSQRPYWQVSDGKATQSNVSLAIYGTAGTEITSAVLGEYVQLRGFFTGEADEKSLQMYNCFATAGDYEYFFVLAGCGEGKILSKLRGFDTRFEQDVNDTTGADRVARSAYFKIFSFPETSQIQFVCDFIVCETEAECDGRSCPDAIYRKKRSVDDQVSANTGTGLPLVISKPIRLLKKPENRELAEPVFGDEMYSVDYDTEYKPHVVESNAPIKSYEELHRTNAVLYKIKVAQTMKNLRMGLLAGMAVMAVAIVSVAVCTCCLIKRRYDEDDDSVSSLKQKSVVVRVPAWISRHK